MRVTARSGDREVSADTVVEIVEEIASIRSADGPSRYLVPHGSAHVSQQHGKLAVCVHRCRDGTKLSLALFDMQICPLWDNLLIEDASAAKPARDELLEDRKVLQLQA